MEGIGAAHAFDAAGGAGMFLLGLLIAFALGALFGRTLLAPNGRFRRSSAAALPARMPDQGDGHADDLKKIPGIGPTVADALAAHGIRSYGALARTSPERLHEILRESGTPATGVRNWPTMAAFLATRER
ncbi:MAG TPA: DUF4332 domain-containing protein [Candidatus Paceibacterota bacterium]|nr:DUF4332 domain-containing protein [Candidatus Paceibacterota bacterium]